MTAIKLVGVVIMALGASSFMALAYLYYQGAEPTSDFALFMALALAWFLFRDAVNTLRGFSSDTR